MLIRQNGCWRLSVLLQGITQIKIGLMSGVEVQSTLKSRENYVNSSRFIHRRLVQWLETKLASANLPHLSGSRCRKFRSVSSNSIGAHLATSTQKRCYVCPPHSLSASPSSMHLLPSKAFRTKCLPSLCYSPSSVNSSNKSCRIFLLNALFMRFAKGRQRRTRGKSSCYPTSSPSFHIKLLWPSSCISAGIIRPVCIAMRFRQTPSTSVVRLCSCSSLHISFSRPPSHIWPWRQPKTQKQV